MNEQVDVFVHDRAADTTRRVPVPRGAATSGEQANGRSDEPQISADGSIVTFRPDAGILVPGDGNDVSDAYAGQPRERGDLAAVQQRRRLGGQRLDAGTAACGRWQPRDLQ